MKYTVNVTMDDIRLERQRRMCSVADSSGPSCPIQRAMRRETQKTVWVGIGTATVYGGNSQQLIDLSPECKRFIREFDRNLRVEPFSFDIDINLPEYP